MVSTVFDLMKITPAVQANQAKMGIRKPMPVQQRAIPALVKVLLIGLAVVGLLYAGLKVYKGGL